MTDKSTHVQVDTSISEPKDHRNILRETGKVELFDFSIANLSYENRVAAVTTIASICYQNPKGAGSLSLFNRLEAEAAGLPSSSFEFIPILLDPKNDAHIAVLGNVNSNIRKFGEWIKESGKDYLLTNYRALVYDCEERVKNMENPTFKQELQMMYLDIYNTEEECNIISKYFKVFRYNVDLVTRAQMVRHRVSWQELSRRYVSGKRVPFDFYISEKMKRVGKEFTTERVIEICTNHYYDALEDGIKPEEARRIIPQGMMTTIWGAYQPTQLENFFKLRLDSHAQKEIQEVAGAMKELLDSIA